MHTGTGRVGDDEVGAAVGFGEGGGEDILHVAGVKFGVGDAVDFGVHVGVGYGLLYVLDADDLAGLFSHEAGDGAGPGVEVVYQLGALQIGEVAGHFIQLVGPGGVGLVERLRADAEAEAFHVFLDVGLAAVAHHLQVVEGFVALVVQHVVEGGDCGELGQHRVQQRLNGLVGAVALQNHHRFASALGGAHDEVAQQAGLAYQVVEGQRVPMGVVADEEADLVARLRLQPAVFHVDNLIEPRWRVEAHHLAVVLLRVVVDLLGGQPAVVAEREFELVAVVGAGRRG